MIQTLSEMHEHIAKIKDMISEATDFFPPYTRTSDCMYKALENVETAEAFFQAEPVIPRNIEKSGDKEDVLTGECPCCGERVTSERPFCSKCGHKSIWK